MKGLEISKRFWEEQGKPVFELECPEILNYAAVGLAGDGSECLGFDDEISRDHDWGPGFCIWYSENTPRELVIRAKKAYGSLPSAFMGFERLNVSEYTKDRVGVISTGAFVKGFLGIDRFPSCGTDWLYVPETGLAMVTNGEIFEDRPGEFTALRQQFRFYPRDVMLKKLAASLALAAQSGQYNYSRCLARHDKTACGLALAQFTEHVQEAVFLLGGRYKPYYKWANRGMAALSVLGVRLAPLMDRLWTEENAGELIEQISRMIIEELTARGLSGLLYGDAGGDYLLNHAFRVQALIEDEALKNLHIMAG